MPANNKTRQTACINYNDQMESCQPVRPRYAEFFAGGGMVTAALRETWDCALANDICEKKCRTYAANWSDENLICGDIGELDPTLLRQPIDLYWASSPCQDFSLAGKGLGLEGERSGVFYKWIEKVRAAVSGGFAPKVIAFENVIGLLSRKQGCDLIRVLSELSKLGYRCGALEIDARHFVAQSRPRLFVIGVSKDIEIEPALITPLPIEDAHSLRLRAFVRDLPASLAEDWIWWSFNQTEFAGAACLNDVIDTECDAWNSKVVTDRLISMMSPHQIDKIRALQKSTRQVIGTVYKRGRPDETGKTVQRAEARFDGIAGCLRTPGGGSSRQTLIFIDGKTIKTRLLTTREAARLMGLPETYELPQRYNEAYHLLGDGVVVPVISKLNSDILLPLLRSSAIQKAA